MYDKRIDALRGAIAVAFAVCGLGWVTLGNAGYRKPSFVLGCGAILALVGAAAVFIEFLLRLWCERRGRTTAVYQLTLAEMMAATAIVALVLAVFRVLGWPTIAILTVAVMILVCRLELSRIAAAKVQRDSEVNEAPPTAVNERKTVS